MIRLERPVGGRWSEGGSMALVPKRFRAFFALPVLRRALYHARRMTGGLDRAFFARVGIALVGFLVIVAAIVTVAEHRDELDGVTDFLARFMDSLYWAVTTVMGAG